MGDRVCRRIVLISGGGGAATKTKKIKNNKTTKPKKIRTTNKKNNASEERGPDIPENPSAFLFFCFSRVFLFLVVPVADKNFRDQKPKKRGKQKKQKKTIPLNKVLGPDVPEKLCVFCCFFVFVFLVFLVFGSGSFYRLLFFLFLFSSFFWFLVPEAFIGY